MLPISDERFCKDCGGYSGLGLPPSTNARVCNCEKPPAPARGWICSLCGTVLSPYTRTCPGDHRRMIPMSEISKYQATLRALREAGDGLVALLKEKGFDSFNSEAIAAWRRMQGV